MTYRLQGRPLRVWLFTGLVCALPVSVPITAAQATIITTGSVSPSVGPGDATVSGSLYIGQSGDGSVEINGGSQADVSFATNVGIGTNDGSLVIDGSGAGSPSTLTTQIFIVGEDASTGSFEVRNGGHLDATGNNNNAIGRNSSGAATAGTQTGLVTGAGSQATFANSLIVGSGEQGALSVENGGTVSTDGFVLIGQDSFGVDGAGAVSVSGTGSLLHTGSLFVGVQGGDASLDVTGGGRAEASSILLSQDSGGTATATVSGAGSSLAATSTASNFVTLTVGRSGAATLDVLDQGQVSSSGLTFIGTFAGGEGTVTVSGAGAGMHAGETIYLGQSGTGTLNIGDNPDTVAVETAGTVDGVRLLAGVAAGSSGTLNATGPDASLNLVGTDGNGNGASLLVGLSGQGTANIANGADVLVDSQTVATGLSGGLLIGGSSSSTATTGSGVLNVDGAGSTLTLATGISAIGNGSAGTLNITNGGTVDGSAQTVAYVGRTATATGAVNVSGTGSTWNAGDILYLGYAGTGTVNIGDNPDTAAVESGGAVNGTRVIAGYDAGSAGTLNVTGPDASLNLVGTDGNGNGASLLVGLSGQGTANITNGADVLVDSQTVATGLSGGLFLGGSSTSTTTTGSGVLNVDGAGSTLTLATGISAIGNGATGTLNVTNGGTVDGSAQTVAYVGRTAAATGRVNVTGAGSTWNAGNILYLGYAGSGTLNIGDDPDTAAVESGGVVNGTRVIAGYDAGSAGTLNVTGPDASLNLVGTDGGGNGASLLVGLFGQGTASITNGADVLVDSQTVATGLSGGLFLGGSSTSTATTGSGVLNVDGAGSTLTLATGVSAIGNGSTGTLNVTNGGTVDGSAQVVSMVGRTGTATGTVNVTGAGSSWNAGDHLVVGAQADLATGAVTGAGGTGTVNVADGGALTAGDIYLGAGGKLTGGGGTVYGNVTSDGTVAAGNSPGIMDIHGDVTLTSLGLTEIELGGTNISLGEYDQINVFDNAATAAAEGNLSVGGTVDVSFFGGFDAVLGDIFDVFTAEQIDVLAPIWNLPTLAVGLDWDIATVALVGGREALRLSVVSNAASVPAPPVSALLVVGLAMFGIARRRRARQSA